MFEELPHILPYFGQKEDGIQMVMHEILQR